MSDSKTQLPWQEVIKRLNDLQSLNDEIKKEMVERIMDAKEAPKSEMLQIFATFIYSGNIDVAKARHLQEIQLALLHSKENVSSSIDSLQGPVYNLRGIKQKFGRLPEKGDEYTIFKGEYFFYTMYMSNEDKSNGQIISYLTIKYKK